MQPTATAPSRAEHLSWCKKRALEYVDSGDLSGAFSSLTAGLAQHNGTADHYGIELGTLLMLGGKLSTADDMRHFIHGFD